jgi:hypothetical protein
MNSALLCVLPNFVSAAILLFLAALLSKKALLWLHRA